MQLSVCFVFASSLLACLSYLYERSSDINYLLLLLNDSVNPCAAETVYIRFQENFKLNKIPLEIATIIG